MSRYSLANRISKLAGEYRSTNKKFPRRLYMSVELVQLLTRKRFLPARHEAHEVGYYYDTKDYVMMIYVVPECVGKNFCAVGDDDDYRNALTEHMLLTDTDSNSRTEEKDEETLCYDNSNVISIFSKRNGGV